MKTSKENPLVEALQLLGDRCPRLRENCYWAGTAAIAEEELHHRQSFDLDFHTKTALHDVRPILAELQESFAGKVKIITSPDRLGSGFRVTLGIPQGQDIPIEVLSNFEDVPEEDLVRSQLAPLFARVSVRRYLADKIQCLVERNEARDLIDIQAVLNSSPQLLQAAKVFLSKQDLSLLTERLLAWTPEDLRADLAAYPDIRVEDAMTMRDILLVSIKELAREKNL